MSAYASCGWWHAQDERARQWRVQAVSVSPGSFENRKSLPAAWMGLRDEALSAVSGIPGCVFVHASGARVPSVCCQGSRRCSTVVHVAGGHRWCCAGHHELL